jgi:glutamate carboxypeptidase
MSKVGMGIPYYSKCMDPLLSYAQAHQDDIAALCRNLVECESPSDDPAAVARFVDLAAERFAELGRVRKFDGGRFGPHLRCEIEPQGGHADGQILVLGHSDTVWPAGTLARMPFREAEGRLWGPGILDMKAGIAFFLFAVRALRDCAVPVRRKLVLQLNSDEEVGSESSRALTEEEARRSVAVLVLEPATGLEGKLKTARKGVGDYTVTVRGKSAHAGLDFTSGANAVVEMARQVRTIAGFTRMERGVTVSPGVIAGGTRSNVIPDEARLEVDVRVLRSKDAETLDRRFRRLRPFDRRCRIEVSGGLNRPPMERTAESARLFEIARALAADLGVLLEESTSGGGSDGNFTAAAGVPTLDGLGAVGEGAHALHESVLVNRIADRTALIARLLHKI